MILLHILQAPVDAHARNELWWRTPVSLGAAEIARRPVTCERSRFNRYGTQLTALMPGGRSF
jgi:hypothetical protein